ncbi:MAG TPA: RNA methyltransferase [Terracidiphilus sp.]|nr:RNA methyltransferase [Terracidiphilus sp.]
MPSRDPSTGAFEVRSDCVDVVLVSPRNPLNTGAAARAMANFGFSRMAVVAPYGPHWREARSAVGAPQVLQEARECGTLAEAVAGCTLVVGTGTLDSRRPRQASATLPALAAKVLPELAAGGRVALVFGPEKHGLTGDDLALCHLIVEIPTQAEQPSMNLGQAVAVCLYELATARLRQSLGEVAGALHSPLHSPMRSESPREATAPSGDLDRLGGLIEETMRAAGYSPRVMQEANRRDLRLMLRRLHVSPADARRVFGLFRRILWRLGHGGGREAR